MKMIYDNWKELIDIDFKNYPEKYEQIKLCKARWWCIEIIVSIWDKVKRILSDDLYFYN